MKQESPRDFIKRQKRKLHQRKDYDVGYGKPPKDTQFKSGQSGNPKGRPKGAKNRPAATAPGPLEELLKGIVLYEAYRPIKINDGDEQVAVPMMTAIVRSIAHKAAKGNVAAQKLMTDMVGYAEADRKRENWETYTGLCELKVQLEKSEEQFRRDGKPLPLDWIRSDQIQINPCTGEAQIVGPLIYEDIVKYRWLERRKPALRTEIETLTKNLRRTRNPDRRAEIEKEIGQHTQMLETILAAIPDPDPTIEAFEKMLKEAEVM